jgi:hypothetical protein
MNYGQPYSSSSVSEKMAWLLPLVLVAKSCRNCFVASGFLNYPSGTFQYCAARDADIVDHVSGFSTRLESTAAVEVVN